MTVLFFYFFKVFDRVFDIFTKLMKVRRMKAIINISLCNFLSKSLVSDMGK